MYQRRFHHNTHGSYRTRLHGRHRVASLEFLQERRLLAADLPLDIPVSEMVSRADTSAWVDISLHNQSDRGRSPVAPLSSPLEMALRLISPHVPKIELEWYDTRNGLASSHFHFRQTVDDRPIAGAVASIHFDGKGRFRSLHASLVQSTDFELAEGPLISSDMASQSAISANGLDSVMNEVDPRMVWFVDAIGNANLSMETLQFATNPVGDFRTYVDAYTGRTLKADNLTAFATGTGNIYAPNPYQSLGSGVGLADNNDAPSSALNAELISVTLPRLDDGTNLIRGQWADLSTLNSTTLPDVDASESDRVYEYTRDDPRFEQVVIYSTIDSIQAYVHELGFDDDTGVANGIRDFPTLANAHWDNADQSFYSTINDAVHFGDGGVDDGEDGDIIAHEYGHAIQFDQHPAWGGGDMGAMGEGFSDYLAASFFATVGDATYQSDDAACVGEWDATSYSSTNPPCLRRVDGDKTYPDDLIGQVHADGEIWSGALWEIRSILGGFTTDQLVLEHHFALPAAATMPEAAEAMLDADESLNGGENRAVMEQIFASRGLLATVPAGVVTFDRDVYGLDDTITIILEDSDLAEFASVPVAIETNSGDSETLSLASLSAGEFTGTISINEGTPVVGNALLDVSAGDSLTVTYQDLDDGSGSPATVVDTANVEALEVILDADFSDDVGAPSSEGFRLEGPSNQWHLSTGRGNELGHSADDSFYFGSGEGSNGGGSYADFADGSLVTPVIDLSTASLAELQFNHWLESEPGFDFADLYVRSNGTSTLLATSEDGSLPVITNGFEPVNLDLSPFVGGVIEIEFRFTSDFSVTNEGWYVDDVRIRVGEGSVPSSSNLVINEIMKNPSRVGDEFGEYFELWNPSESPIDINGFTIRDDDINEHVIEHGEPLLVPANGYLVLGRNANTAINGEVVVDYQYDDFELANGTDEVVLVNVAGIEVDRVVYSDNSFPDDEGASMEFIPGISAPSVANDLGSNWRSSTNPIGFGSDMGTPGSINSGVDVVAPRVESVHVASSQWSPEFLGAVGSGGIGVLLEGPDQLRNLPWLDGIDRIYLTFDEDVSQSIGPAQVSVWGVNTFDYSPEISFAYGVDGSNTATITLVSPIVSDRVLIQLEGIRDRAGNHLDGEWTDSVSIRSGDGVPGGDFGLQFNVLAGDVTNDDAVNLTQDVLTVFSMNGTVPSTVGEAYFDVDSSGAVNLTGDVLSTFELNGSVLTSEQPTGPISEFDIEVVFPDDTLSESQQSLFELAASRWEQIIVGDVPDVGSIDDVRIEATAPSIDGVGNILGQAGPTFVRTDSRIPLQGIMQFDAADVAALEASGDLSDVILHEMGHVLGLGTIWDDLGLLDDDPEDPRFLGEAATAEYNAIFGLAESSVPVEDDGGPGTALGHWEEDDLRNGSSLSFGAELMTGFLNAGVVNPISRITIAQFQDIGYEVEFRTADDFLPSAANAKPPEQGSGGRFVAVTPTGWLNKRPDTSLPTAGSINLIDKVLADIA
ncbi:MAG: lamin tail domain-containing protein [Planctomycetota bacterium]